MLCWLFPLSEQMCAPSSTRSPIAFSDTCSSSCSAHSEVGLGGQRDGTEVRPWGTLSDAGVRQLVGTVVREGFQRGVALRWRTGRALWNDRTMGKGALGRGAMLTKARRQGGHSAFRKLQWPRPQSGASGFPEHWHEGSESPEVSPVERPPAQAAYGASTMDDCPGALLWKSSIPLTLSRITQGLCFIFVCI